MISRRIPRTRHVWTVTRNINILIIVVYGVAIRLHNLSKTRCRGFGSIILALLHGVLHRTGRRPRSRMGDAHTPLLPPMHRAAISLPLRHNSLPISLPLWVSKSVLAPHDRRFRPAETFLTFNTQMLPPNRYNPCIMHTHRPSALLRSTDAHRFFHAASSHVKHA